MRGNWPDNLEHVITFMPLICSSQMFSKIMAIKEVRCYEAKIEESEEGRQLPRVEPRTPPA